MRRARVDHAHGSTAVATGADLGLQLILRLLEHTAHENAVDPFLLFVFVAVGRDAPSWVRQELLTDFIAVLASRLDGDDIALRAEPVCGHIIGVSAMRRSIQAPALSAATPDELAEHVGSIIQDLIDGRVR